MHQSWPGVLRRRVSQPSIHLPTSVYLSSIQTGVDAFKRFSFGAKNSSLAASTRPPSRSAARSMYSVKSISVRLDARAPLEAYPGNSRDHKSSRHAEKWLLQRRVARVLHKA